MRPVFIDFEASGLGEESWPIEIGVAWIADHRIEMRSTLIRPRPEWPASEWSPESAAIHGMPREALDAAPSADMVATEYATLLARRPVLSDARLYDERWWCCLAVLLDPGQDVVIRDFEVTAFATFRRNPHALDVVLETYTRAHSPHRAGPDARRLAKAWQEGLRVMNGIGGTPSDKELR